MADEDVFDDRLDELLDSALEDFQKAEKAKLQSKSQGSLSPSTSDQGLAPLGQGLGTGLPALRATGKKKSGSTKSPNTASTQKEASTLRASNLDPSSSSMAATLEMLAAQTRQTVESIEANPSDENTVGNELVENLVKQFEELGGSQDMQSIMDTMMQQLLSKDILHEPMKEIGERYPDWLEANKSKLSPEEFDRYSRQYRFIMELCNVYDTTPDEFPKIVDLMQKMQDCGQPPSDIVRELAPGLELGEDGLPVLPDFPLAGAQGGKENCNVM